MVPGGNMTVITTLSESPQAMTYRRSGVNEYIYFCASSSGKIRRKHVQSGTEIELPWPVASMRCDGYSLAPTPNGVAFIYTTNSLNGFAEILDSI
jgi:hypothetical protein